MESLIDINRPVEKATEHYEVAIIGGGQAGLAAGYHLAQRGFRFVILEANERIGDSWRKRWDSLRLFTPARYNGLPGMSFPGPARSYPTKDEMAGYLEAYATRFDLPVRTGVRVDGLSRNGAGFLLTLAGAAILSGVYLFGHRLAAWERSRRVDLWLSFAAGSSVAYVFLHIIPHIAEEQEHVAGAFPDYSAGTKPPCTLWSWPALSSSMEYAPWRMRLPWGSKPTSATLRSTSHSWRQSARLPS